MNRLFQIFILLAMGNIGSGFGQQANYLDSLSLAISNLDKRGQINTINAIPYDKAVGNIKKYEKLTNKAIRCSQELEDDILMADSYISKALPVYLSGRNEDALKLTFEAIDIYKKNNQITKVGEVYASLGWKIKQLDLEKGFFYMQKGIKILEKQGALSHISQAYDNYGVLHGMTKNWDSAIYYHKKSLQLKKQLKDSVGIPFGYSHLANVHLHQNEYDLALKYLDSAYTIRQNRHDIFGITDTHLYYGDLYFAKGDFERAIFHFEKGYRLSSKNKYHPLKKYAAEYLYKGYRSLGDYQKALEYNLIFNSLKDSVVNIGTNSEIAELEIKYQTAEKEAALARTQVDLAAKELQVKRRNTMLYGSLFLVVLLMFTGYSLYNRGQTKNRRLIEENRLKSALGKIKTQNRLQTQRLRISRDLHDNIGSQLTFIISSLDNLKFGFKGNHPDIKQKITEISLFTGSTINELRDTIWAMNKDKIALEDLIGRISNLISTGQKISDKINFILKVDPTVDLNHTFSSTKGMNIYRIIQEAINNAIKHASASSINVLFGQDKNWLRIQIIDDGTGFEKDRIEHSGLSNMRHRAERLKAVLDIKSTPQNGTAISMEIPLKPTRQKN